MNISGLNLNDERTLALLIPFLAIGGGLFLGLVSMVIKGVRDVVRTKHQEISRREIAAYVAEGTMSPDDAAKLLEAGTRKKGWGCC